MPSGVPQTTCKICGGTVAERSELTARGKHLACSERKVREEIHQLVAHRGPHFDHWRARCIAAFGNPHLERPAEYR